MADDRAGLLVDYIRTGLLAGQEVAVGAHTPLLATGILDSMGIVLLAAFVEERFGVRIDDADLRAGGVETIADLLVLVDRRRAIQG